MFSYGRNVRALDCWKPWEEATAQENNHPYLSVLLNALKWQLCVYCIDFLICSCQVFGTASSRAEIRTLIASTLSINSIPVPSSSSSSAGCELFCLNQEHLYVSANKYLTFSCHFSLYSGSLRFNKGERERGEIPFFPLDIVGQPSLCVPFLPSFPPFLQSVPHSLRALMFASHSSFYPLVHWLSFNYDNSLVHCFWKFSSCLPLGL